MTSTAASSGCSGIWPPGTPSRWGRRWTSSRAMPPSSGWTDAATCSDRWSMPRRRRRLARLPGSPATSARPAIASCVRWGGTPRWDVIEAALRRPASDDPRTTRQPWPGRTPRSTCGRAPICVLGPAGAGEPGPRWVGGDRPAPRARALTDDGERTHHLGRMPRSSPPYPHPLCGVVLPSDESSLSRTRWSVPTDGRVAFPGR